MARLQLETSMTDAITALAQGNPGAATVCVEILKRGSSIDPLAWGAGIAHLFNLDTLEVYGSDIWVLYKEICQEHLGKMIGLLRANQLGLLSNDALKTAIFNAHRREPHGIDVDGLVAEIVQELGGEFYPEEAPR